MPPPSCAPTPETCPEGGGGRYLDYQIYRILIVWVGLGGLVAGARLGGWVGGSPCLKGSGQGLGGIFLRMALDVSRKM